MMVQPNEKLTKNFIHFRTKKSQMEALISPHLGWIQFIFRLEVTLFMVHLLNMTYSVFIYNAVIIHFIYSIYVYFIFPKIFKLVVQWANGQFCSKKQSKNNLQNICVEMAWSWSCPHMLIMNVSITVADVLYETAVRIIFGLIVAVTGAVWDHFEQFLHFSTKLKKI